MERVISLIGILVFFGVAYFFSIDRRAINLAYCCLGICYSISVWFICFEGSDRFCNF